jgi:hypothetical protein
LQGRRSLVFASTRLLGSGVKQLRKCFRLSSNLLQRFQAFLHYSADEFNSAADLFGIDTSCFYAGGPAYQ